ncbi:hypothetical protein PtB15_9B334 [Puccinia triticina]|nr:hypothetical protein PtB15_9B334 [Puccinia triticina]
MAGSTSDGGIHDTASLFLDHPSLGHFHLQLLGPDNAQPHPRTNNPTLLP